MIIKHVEARSLQTSVVLEDVAAPRKHSLTACVVHIVTECGRVGESITTLGGGLEAAKVLSGAINTVVGPAIIGESVLRTEKIFEKLSWIVTPRGQGGFAY